MPHRVLVADTFLHQLFRGELGLYGQIAAKNETIETDETKFEIYGSPWSVFVRRRKGERMVSTCMVPTMKHRGGGVMVWGCFAGDTVGDLLKTEGTLNLHGYHSIL